MYRNILLVMTTVFLGCSGQQLEVNTQAPIGTLASSNLQREFESLTLAVDSLEQEESSVLHAANYSSIIAPGSIGSFFSSKTFIANPVEVEDGLPKTELGGISVYIRTKAGDLKSKIYYVGINQINFVMPIEVQDSNVQVIVVDSEGTVVDQTFVDIEESAFGFFTQNQKGNGRPAGQVTKPDGRAFSLGDYDSPRKGDILSFYGTGLGNVIQEKNVSFRIGSREEEIVYIGPQNQFEGLDQINVKLGVDHHFARGQKYINSSLKIDDEIISSIRFEAPRTCTNVVAFGNGSSAAYIWSRQMAEEISRTNAINSAKSKCVGAETFRDSNISYNCQCENEEGTFTTKSCSCSARVEGQCCI